MHFPISRTIHTFSCSAYAIVFLVLSINPCQASAETKHYDWLTEGDKTGYLTIQSLSPHERKAEFTFNIAGYGPNISEHYQLDQSGLIRTLTISGSSYFGLPLNESFTLKSDLAQWHSPVEQGSEVLDQAKFYFPNEGTLASWTDLIRYALKQSNHSVMLLPLGTLSVKKLLSHPVTVGQQTKTVSLYAASGFDFSPEYIWLDETLDLFAASYDNRWGAIILKDWNAALPELQALQEKIENEYWQTFTQNQSYRLSQPLLITNVDVFDSNNATMLSNHDVLINNGRIINIDKKIPKPKSSNTLDGSGKTMLPGLWDMHTHARLEDGVLNIAAGVTNARDMGNDINTIQTIKQAFDDNRTIGPRLFLAGFIDQKSKRDISIGKVVETLEQAIEAVNWYADHHYHQIKLYSSIDPDWVKPIAEATHQRGLRLSGHIPAFMNAEQAIYAGYDEIQHMTMIFLNFVINSKTDTRTGLRFTAVAEKAGKLNLNAKVIREFIELLKRKNVAIDPTVVGYIAMFTQKMGQIDPRYRSIAEHLPPSVYRRYLNPEMEVNDENQQAYQASAQALLGMLKKLYDNGITLLPGTDAMPGFTLHSELEAFAEAGIPNAKVLQIATLESAKITNMESQLGSIEKGKIADFILLDGNPLINIEAIRKVSLVVKGKYVFFPERLYQALGVKPFTTSINIKGINH